VGKAITLGARGGCLIAVSFAIAGQETTRQWAPGNDAHTLIPTQGQHLPLFFAVDSVQVILHGDEARPAIKIGRILRFGKLPGKHAGGANVTCLTGPHDVMKRFHGFLNRRRVIPAMNLVQINVVCAQAAQRIFNGGHNVLARQSPIIP